MDTHHKLILLLAAPLVACQLPTSKQELRERLALPDEKMRTADKNAANDANTEPLKTDGGQPSTTNSPANGSETADNGSAGGVISPAGILAFPSEPYPSTKYDAYAPLSSNEYIDGRMSVGYGAHEKNVGQTIFVRARKINSNEYDVLAITDCKANGNDLVPSRMHVIARAADIALDFHVAHIFPMATITNGALNLSLVISARSKEGNAYLPYVSTKAGLKEMKRPIVRQFRPGEGENTSAYYITRTSALAGTSSYSGTEFGPLPGTTGTNNLRGRIVTTTGKTVRSSDDPNAADFFGDAAASDEVNRYYVGAGGRRSLLRKINMDTGAMTGVGAPLPYVNTTQYQYINDGTQLLTSMGYVASIQSYSFNFRPFDELVVVDMNTGKYLKRVPNGSLPGSPLYIIGGKIFGYNDWIAAIVASGDVNADRRMLLYNFSTGRAILDTSRVGFAVLPLGVNEKYFFSVVDTTKDPATGFFDGWGKTIRCTAKPQ